MGDLGQRGDVGRGPEIGGRDDDRGGCIGPLFECSLEVFRPQAVGHPQLRVDLGGGKVGHEPGHDHPVDDRGVDISLGDQGLSGVGDCEAHRLVSLGGTVEEEPGPLGPPGIGRQLLGLLERVRVANVDSLDQGRDVVGQCGLAGQQPEGIVCSDPSLVSRNVEPTWVTPGVGQESIDVGRSILVGHRASVEPTPWTGLRPSHG